MRFWKLVTYIPMACLPMADWYVLRGDCRHKHSHKHSHTHSHKDSHKHSSDIVTRDHGGVMEQSCSCERSETMAVVTLVLIVDH